MKLKLRSYYSITQFGHGIRFASNIYRRLIMLAQMLPEEVLELILQNLLRDRSSISACTLVCRSWSFPSSRHLFGEIKLTPTVDDSSQESNWYEDFLAKLQETARVREHVRQLVFTTTRSDGLPACHLTVLQHIFACLPHLWSFEMSYLNISTSNPSAFARSLSTQVPPLTVHKMKLDNILAFSTCDGVVVESGMAQSTGLAAFLNLFDEIEELYLNNSGLPWMSPIWHLLEANPSPLPRQNLLRLRAVHLAGYQATKMSPALQGMIELSHVKQLSVEMSPYVLASINDFVGSIPNLEILHLAARRDLVKSGLAEAPGMFNEHHHWSEVLRLHRRAGTSARSR